MQLWYGLQSHFLDFICHQSIHGIKLNIRSTELRPLGFSVCLILAKQKWQLTIHPLQLTIQQTSSFHKVSE
jgi:hypothetical protein